MKRNVFCFLVTISLAMTAPTLRAEPPKSKHSSARTEKSRNTTANALLESANGWNYVKGEWVHPQGYKFVNGKILRTTAKYGQPLPKPPGKLALENPQKLTQQSKSIATQSEAEKKAEERRKNLQPRPAPQTGSHM
jgi:hypothetical protein